jgi:TetR/AcrR family transcriptional repressor of nem operon
MGAAAQDLPAEVAAEVQRFFSMCLKEMVKAGLPRDGAARLLATISGAMLLAIALDDRKAYDQATRDLLQEAELSAA